MAQFLFVLEIINIVGETASYRGEGPTKGKMAPGHPLNMYMEVGIRLKKKIIERRLAIGQ